MNEWKIGDKLVCLDVEAYLAIDNKWVLSRQKIVESSLIVDHIHDNGAIGLEDVEYCIPTRDFQYFKKKEERTFNDLIDVAVQGYKDGVLSGLSLDNVGVRKLSYWGKGFDNHVFAQHEDYTDSINSIESLYKETFVIESIEQMNKITFKKDAKITLSNGEVLHESVICSLSKFNNDVAFCVLKGATVEQERT